MRTFLNHASSSTRSDSQIEGISLSGGWIRSLASSETKVRSRSLATHAAVAEIRVSSGQFNKNCSSFLPHPVDSRKSSRLEKLRLILVPLKVPLNVCKCLGSRSRSTPRPEKVMPEHPAKCSSRSCKVEGKPEAMAERPVSVTFVQPMKSRYSLCSPWQNRDLSKRSS